MRRLFSALTIVGGVAGFRLGGDTLTDVFEDLGASRVSPLSLLLHTASLPVLRDGYRDSRYHVEKTRMSREERNILSCIFSI